MTILHHVLNRRLFLKLSLSLAGLFMPLRSKSVGAMQAQYPSVTGGYGAGAYGQDEYPGYKIYLSWVSKEGK